MSEWQLFLNYIKDLLKQWYFTATLIVGLIDIFIRPFFNIPFPWWAFLSLFGLAFIVSNYQLYRHAKDQIRQLQEQRQQELSQIQTEINTLKNREPRLDLRFTDTNTKRAVLRVSKLPELPDIEALVLQEAKNLEQAYYDSVTRDTSSEESVLGAGSVLKDFLRIEPMLHGSLKSKTEYDEDCKGYLEDYHHFLVARTFHESYLARYRTLEIEVENTGTHPASDIVVVIDFPDGLHFPITPEEQEPLLLGREPPKAPTAPSLYKSNSFGSIGLSSDFFLPRIYNNLPDLDLGRSNVSGPFIKPKNSTEVSYKINQLMHNFIEELEPAGFFVTKTAIEHTLELTYSIHATELVRPVQGSLIVAVEILSEE